MLDNSRDDQPTPEESKLLETVTLGLGVLLALSAGALGGHMLFQHKDQIGQRSAQSEQSEAQSANPFFNRNSAWVQPFEGVKWDANTKWEGFGVDAFRPPDNAVRFEERLNNYRAGQK